MGSLGNNGNDRDRDGGVDAPRADQHDLETYEQAAAQLDQLRIPVLLHAGNPHERLYIAAPDGTGNSRVNATLEKLDCGPRWGGWLDSAARAGVEPSWPLTRIVASMRFFPHTPNTAARRAAALLCAFLSAACQPAMSTSAMPGSAPRPSGDGSYSTTTADWPLKFRGHKFGAFSYSTYGCKLYYRGMLQLDEPDDELQIASDSVANYPDNLNGSWGPISNFPPRQGDLALQGRHAA